MPLQQTSGNVTADAYGGGAAAVPNYIEDVFSTWLYTGTGASQTITNNINTTTYGGLTWIKGRSGATGHRLTDTTRGVTKSLESNSTAAETTETTGLTAFGTTGFTIGADADYNTSAATYVSWTFREQPKFFDVVTYTGTGANRTIAHSLGSVPGCIIVKRTDTTGDWQVYHGSLANTQYMVLNTTAAVATGATRWNSTTPTSTVFSVGTDATVNASGGTYVAYIYAHDAGGFGLTGTDNVISCGSFTTDGSGLATVSLGYEPQWVLAKRSSGIGGWNLLDTMRGMAATPGTSNTAALFANLSDAETAGSNNVFPTATGLYVGGLASSSTYIYIAIRRGPMKVPTTGTSVFAPVTQASGGSTTTITTNFPVDLSISYNRSGGDPWWIDRLRGDSTSNYNILDSSNTNAELINSGFGLGFDNNTGYIDNLNGPAAGYTGQVAYWNFKRAPSFFDEVCYTGTGSNTTITHNLQAVPELMIVKCRSTTGNWAVYSSATGNGNTLLLQTTNAAFANANWNSTTPTSSVFSIGVTGAVNTSGATYVAYLFATCAGVSKVGSYTGTGATQTVACGFGAGGARFVLVKRTDTTGDWYVWDSARGMVSGTDPSLLLNGTAAEVNANSVYTATGGFQIVSTAAGINASGGTYIFLSVA